MSIASDIIRGHTETIILSQLESNDSYGYEINKNIQKRTDNKYELKDATLYSAFRRLEDAKYIASYWGEEGAGARRRYYSITDLGRIACTQNKKDWEAAKTMIDTLIYNEEAKK